MLFPRLALTLMALPVALSLAGCQKQADDAFSMAVVGKTEDIFQTGAAGLSPGGLMVRGATVEGLVTLDAAGRLAPALADRWIVTDDGQSYIFRLRDGHWANGDPLTAESARTAILAAIEGFAGTAIAQDLDGIEDVRAMAGRVIEFRLNRPMPYLLQLLAQPELGLQHEGQGAGPMALQRKGAWAELTPINPAALGMPEIERWKQRTRTLRLQAMSGDAAIAAFNKGEVDLVVAGRVQDFTQTRSVGLLRGTIQLDPVIGLFGLLAVHDQGFMATPANREALSMAIDRAGLIEPFGLSGWTPTTRVVTPSLDGDLGTLGERWGEQSLESRRAVAADRVRVWAASRPQGQRGLHSPARVNAVADGLKTDKKARGDKTAKARLPERIRLRIWLPKGSGSDILFTRLSQDWGTIGVGLSRAASPADADMVLIDDIARYPRAAWFLNRLSCRAKRGLCSPEADARVVEAGQTVSPVERAALLTEAEAELTAANVFIPFGPPIRWSLVRGNVHGFATNNTGFHPLMPLAWLPK